MDAPLQTPDLRITRPGKPGQLGVPPRRIAARALLLTLVALPVALPALGADRGRSSAWGPPPPVAPHGLAPLPARRVVHRLVFPVLGPVRYTSPYGEPRDGYRHPGVDIVAPKWTPIVAPISGTLGMKRESFWIWGDDGWGVLGTHLNDSDPGKRDGKGGRDVMFAPDLRPGMHVEAGRFIGYLGESGNATGPHLHLELYAPGNMGEDGRREMGNTRGCLRDPSPSLHAALRLARASAPTLPGDPPAPGSARYQGCVRKVIPDVSGRPGSLTLLLVAKQDARGPARAITRVRYLRLQVSDAVAEAAGGWDALARLPETASVGVFVKEGHRPDDQPALRIEPSL